MYYEIVCLYVECYSLSVGFFFLDFLNYCLCVFKKSICWVFLNVVF